MSGIYIDANAGTIGISEFVQQQFGPTIISHLYAHNEEMAKLINSRIQDRTSVLTGALRTAEKYTVNTDPNSADMVVFYASDAEQMAAWKRVYVAYQEGGDLGKPTYTNPPRLMYAKVETEDIYLLQDWGYNALEEGVGLLAEGQGII